MDDRGKFALLPRPVGEFAATTAARMRRLGQEALSFVGFFIVPMLFRLLHGKKIIPPSESCSMFL